MSQSYKKAIEFLSSNIKLTSVELDDISGLYASEKYENCDIYMFEVFETSNIGSTSYIAVPKDSSSPFFIGELGE